MRPPTDDDVPMTSAWQPLDTQDKLLVYLNGTEESFDDLKERCTDVNVDGVVIHFASLDDIIYSKTHADRPKDRDALPELHRLRGTTDC